MNKFKEWLSDYLRYIILAVIIVLVIAAAILGLNIYSKTVNNQGSKESEAVKETETQSESKLTVVREPESETQSESRTEKSTESGNNSLQAAAQPETKATPETTPETAPQTEPPTEAPTEAPETDPPAPVYKTMTGTCYLRAEPTREAAILGEYWAGTTVEFLGEVSGWYKVQVDGMTGYMGPRFFD